MKKILCLLLVVLMVLPLAVACGNDEKPPVSTDDGTSNDSGDAGDSTPATSSRAHNIPVDEIDFGNEEYRTVANEWQGYKHYFFAEEESSNPMEAAIYNRRRAIEEELGVTMTHFFYPDSSSLNTAVEQDITIGQTEIDTVLMHCIYGTAKFAFNGFLYPMETLRYVDLEADWWNLTQMESLRIDTHYYFGVNDYMIPCPYVIFFNKEMVEDMADMQDPYQLVLDDKWTFDLFEEMARAATSDLNTDGVYDYENDSFGVACEDPSNYCSFLPAFDQPFTVRGDDGKLDLAMNSEKTVDIVSRFADMSKASVFYPDVYTEPNQVTMDSGRLLFLLGPVTYTENLRDCEVDFGILPYPKYNEEQDGYRSLDWGGLMCVPNCVANPDLTGAVIELLAFKSEEEVIPAYYDVVLDGQLARDPQTAKMLDILFGTICYDPGLNFWGFTSPITTMIFYLPNEAINNQNVNWSSFYGKIGEGSQLVVDTFYETLELFETLG